MNPCLFLINILLTSSLFLENNNNNNTFDKEKRRCFNKIIQENILVITFNKYEKKISKLQL